MPSQRDAIGRTHADRQCSYVLALDLNTRVGGPWGRVGVWAVEGGPRLHMGEIGPVDDEALGRRGGCGGGSRDAWVLRSLLLCRLPADPAEAEAAHALLAQRVGAHDHLLDVVLVEVEQKVDDEEEDGEARDEQREQRELVARLISAGEVSDLEAELRQRLAEEVDNDDAAEHPALGQPLVALLAVLALKRLLLPWQQREHLEVGEGEHDDDGVEGAPLVPPLPVDPVDGSLLLRRAKDVPPPRVDGDDDFKHDDVGGEHAREYEQAEHRESEPRGPRLVRRAEQLGAEGYVGPKVERRHGN
eukprot:6180364-Pleurochrysis_carterae.AAC.1